MGQSLLPRHEDTRLKFPHLHKARMHGAVSARTCSKRTPIMSKAILCITPKAISVHLAACAYMFKAVAPGAMNNMALACITFAYSVHGLP
jgi:hypothetical protein